MQGVEILGKIKIHELAKELELPSKEVLEKAQKLGIDVTSHLSNIDDEQANKIRKEYAKNNNAKQVKENKVENKKNAKKETKKDTPVIIRREVILNDEEDSKKDNKKAKPAPEAAPASAPAPAAPVAATPSVSADSTMSDDELIAVISAAIAAYEDDMAGSNVPADGLIVRSIKKRGFN